MRIIHFELIKILSGNKSVRVQVANLEFKNDKGFQEIWATPKGGSEMLVDDMSVFLFEGTNSFDKTGKLIFHGDILKDSEGNHYEVMYANGSFFIVAGEKSYMLEDKIVRQLERVGDIVRNYQLIAKPVDEGVFNKKA